ncbi:MAG: ribosome small subunit-dependent GTPase A [Candidatus Cloacimonetes bacterium]|nr:ribosome small subunit-dependent GTPase A [Candidatus Cloacimonadota bacterium]
MNLSDLGWKDFFENSFSEYKTIGYQAGRVAFETKNKYLIFCENGEKEAILSDKLWKGAFYRSELPAVGDWVAFSEIENSEQVKIQAVLPRFSKFSRKAVNTYGRNFDKGGGSEEQIISVNVDTIFLVISMDRDFNLRKIERYLTMIWDSGANPVIVLNKSDLTSHPEEYINDVQAITMGLPVISMSAAQKNGIEKIIDHIQTGKTISLIGSSGVGKSTIINALLDEDKMYVSANRETDKRGRHTTTHRELILLPDGGILIDNPGMRDIKSIASEEALDETFSDVTELISQCRFKNCQHDTEPDCAVKEAIRIGTLSAERYESYLKLQREIAYYSKRKFFRKKYEESGRWKLDRVKKNKRQKRFEQE